MKTMLRLRLGVRVPNEGARRLAHWMMRQPVGTLDRMLRKTGIGQISLERMMAGELTPDASVGYIFANPQGIAGPTLWGRPVVPTKGIGAANFLVGAFKLAAQIFDRMETEVRISDQDRDNFIRNMLTIRAEKRLAMAVKRAAAMVRGTLL